MISILFAVLTSCVDVRLERGVEKGPVEIRVGIDAEHGTRWIAQSALPPARSTATFCDLPAGAYTILARGAEPLQVIQRLVVAKPGERAAVAIALPVGRLRGVITHGGKPLRGATVKFHAHRPNWTAVATTDENGEIAGGIWSGGEFDVAITGGGLASSRLTTIRIDGFPNGRFAIDLPKREIRGRIRDARGAPVANAQVSMQSEQDDMTPIIRARSDAEGRFVFSAVEAGHHTLYALSHAHLRPEPVEVLLAESDALVEKEIVVEEGLVRAVEVTRAGGGPVAFARVVCTRNGRVVSTGDADAAGLAKILTPADAGALVGAFAGDGSFLLTRLARPAAGTAPAPLRLVVPTAGSSLEVATMTDRGEPISDVSMVIRYNGEFLPPGMLMLKTGADGRARAANLPSGSYELWPYESAAEAELIAGTAVAAPIHVNVVPGENKVTVKFSERF